MGKKKKQKKSENRYNVFQKELSIYVKENKLPKGAYKNYKSLYDIRSEFLKNGFEVVNEWENYENRYDVSWIRVAKHDQNELVYADDLSDDYDEKGM